MSFLKKMWRHICGCRDGVLNYMLNILIPYFPSKRARCFMMRLLGVSMGKNVRVFYGFSIRSPKKLTIEDGVSIGPKVLLDARCGLTIKKNAVVAYDAIVWTLNHDYNDVQFCGKGAPVEIGAFSWICSRSIILPGVIIGEGAVVASGAIVTKDVEPYSIVAGIPARKIGERKKIDYSYGYDSRNDFSHIV